MAIAGPGGSCPGGISIDPAGGFVYLIAIDAGAVTGRIRKVSISNPSSTQDIITGLTEPVGTALLFPAPPPVPATRPATLLLLAVLLAATSLLRSRRARLRR
jgi:hypothetical protein